MTLLFTNVVSQENPGYDVRHRVGRAYDTLRTIDNYRYNAPPKDSAEADEKKPSKDTKGKSADKKDEGTNEEKNTAEKEEASDTDDEKGKSSAKDESTVKEKAKTKGKRTKKDKSSAKEDESSGEKGEDTATEDKTRKEDTAAGGKEEDTAAGDKAKDTVAGEEAGEDTAEGDETGEATAAGDEPKDATAGDETPVQSSEKSAAKKYSLQEIADVAVSGKSPSSRGGRKLFPGDEKEEEKFRVLELVVTLVNNRTEQTTREFQSTVAEELLKIKNSLASTRRMVRTRCGVDNSGPTFLERMFAIDCSDLAHKINTTGLQTFNLEYKGKRPVTVMCDMETDGGGWTVVQRRNGDLQHINFNRGWHEYKVGFGDPAGEYWVGLDNLHAWTNMRQYQLRIDLKDFEGNCKYAMYDHFYIDDEAQGYRLHVSGYLGSAGDALTRKNVRDNFTADGMMFTTKDRDNDLSSIINCAQYWKSGGWWYNRCSWANLNGPSWKQQSDGSGIGINWHVWHNKEHLKSAIMMIRPAGR